MSATVEHCSYLTAPTWEALVIKVRQEWKCELVAPDGEWRDNPKRGSEYSAHPCPYGFMAVSQYQERAPSFFGPNSREEFSRWFQSADAENWYNMKMALAELKQAHLEGKS